jgi:hypothetical protein
MIYDEQSLGNGTVVLTGIGTLVVLSIGNKILACASPRGFCFHKREKIIR